MLLIYRLLVVPKSIKMKKKLRLKTVLKIREHLESIIESTYDDILSYNDTEIKVDLLLDRALKASEQLIVVKEAIQKANQGKHKTGKTNNYYIYRYSNLQTLKRFYLRIKDVDPLDAQISPDEARTQIRKINTELDLISTKLSNFNQRKKVVIVLDSTLKLDLELLQNL